MAVISFLNVVWGKASLSSVSFTRLNSMGFFFLQFLACRNKTDITTTIVCGLSRLLSAWSPAKFSQSRPFGVNFLWKCYVLCLGTKWKKCSKGNDGEPGSLSVFSPLQSCRWGAARGGALGSLNDFLPRSIQWKALNREVQSLHMAAGPESLWKNCNRAPHIHTFTNVCYSRGTMNSISFDMAVPSLFEA